VTNEYFMWIFRNVYISITNLILNNIVSLPKINNNVLSKKFEIFILKNRKILKKKLKITKRKTKVNQDKDTRI